MMTEMMRLQFATVRMMAEAQTVIGLRMLGMAGVLPAAPMENARMVSEKQHAFSEAGMAAARAMMTGRGPLGAWSAALAPIGRTTRANSKRLSKGPKAMRAAILLVAALVAPPVAAQGVIPDPEPVPLPPGVDCLAPDGAGGGQALRRGRLGRCRGLSATSPIAWR